MIFGRIGKRLFSGVVRHPKIPLLRNRARRDWGEVNPQVKRVLLATLIGCLPVFLIARGIADRIEPVLLSTWFDVRGSREVPKSVTIVRIDKRAYDVVNLPLGEMFPRDRLAQAIDAIATAGAKIIVLDGVLQRPGPDPEVDQKLAASLAKAPIIIGKYDETLIDVDPEGRQTRRRHAVTPIPLFAGNAKAVVSLEVRVTRGVVREISLSTMQHIYSEANVPFLGPIQKYVNPEAQEPGERDYINFYGGPNTITSVSLADLITPGTAIDPAYFKDRVVLIGILSEARTGIAAGKDTFSTSVSANPMYGVEVHANIAANLVDGSWIRRPTPLVEGAVSGLLALAICYAMLVSGPLLGFAVTAVWFGISYFAFTRINLFLPGLTVFTVVLLFAAVFLWGIPAFMRGWQMRRERLAMAADTLSETGGLDSALG